MATAPSDDDLAAGVRAGDRRALARAITLVESTRPDHRSRALALLEDLLAEAGGSVRVGISGPPGVGKSTFIEALGSHLADDGRRVAVLAVDPTSVRTQGSILGDKTRMGTLARHERAFIRPSPSGGELGGVARRTSESILLCEAAGFDVVLVETVGVGQSEVAVAELTDVFVLLASPTGGDDLQGIKRGVMELADLVVVTKADGDLAAAARHACADLRRALHLLRPKHPDITPEALLASSVTGEGVGEVWEAVTAVHRALDGSGRLADLRADQDRRRMWTEVRAGLLARIARDPHLQELSTRLEEEVVARRRVPAAAAEDLLRRLG